jgi:hypothetical protein
VAERIEDIPRMIGEAIEAKDPRSASGQGRPEEALSDKNAGLDAPRR